MEPENNASVAINISGGSGSCTFPGSPAHSSIEFTNDTLRTGTTAIYSCEAGFELLGPSVRTCKNGEWLPEGIPFCVLNVAVGKAPMQVSTEDLGVATKAIDGNTEKFFDRLTCTLTKMQNMPWWYVNLLEPYMVQLVRLDFGKPCCGSKTATIVVRVGNNRPDIGPNPICNRFSGFIEVGQPLFLPCNPPMPGAFVSVHLEVETEQQLSICEAFVYTDQALPIERCPQFRDNPLGNTATYNGKCYVFYNQNPMPFVDAQQFCKHRGGTLIDESNPALQGFISWELWRKHKSDSQGQYWMGAIRRSDGRWKWLNGNDLTVSFWNHPQSNPNGNCARYDGIHGWLWSDTDCNIRLNYICQHQPKACGRPEQPPNSTMLAPDFNVGSVVEYSCDEGHLLVGPSMRTCLETGFYNVFPPVCKRIQCGYPADIPNGAYSLVNDSVGYLSRVIYSCFEGYIMIGRAQLSCDFDERWNGPPPRCEPVQCEYPQAIQNGFFELQNNDTSFGSVITYKCKRGFNLIGSSEISCAANGQYDSLTPTCEEDSSIQRTTTLQPLIVRTSSGSTRTRTRTSRPPPTTIKATNSEITTKHHQTTLKTRKSTQRPSVHHPQDNEIAGSISSNIQHNENPISANLPLPVDSAAKDDHHREREPFGARLNVGAIIALGAFGAFIFLAAIITTVVILVRRNQSAKHYRHRASPDCNTVASFDSSSSESRNGGLNRYYRQAWQNLHESAGSKSSPTTTNHHHHSPLRRKETMDEPSSYHRGRDKDASEVVVVNNNAAEKKRHHHHHHHHQQQQNGNNRPPGGHNKRY